MRVGVMAWLCVASDGSSKLMRCDSPMNSRSYIAKVLTPNLSFIRPHTSRRGQSVLFQQDNASCHVSKVTKAWLTAHRVKLLEPWPALSPDLNIVEHCWSLLSKNMVGKSFSTADSLWEGIQAAWFAVPATYVKGLYASYVRRLAAVTVARGGPTRY